jgi:bifunctional non-homologous end joining protein LigD
MSSPYDYNLKPMLATLTDKAFDGKDWVYEIKFDGYRVISKIYKKNVELVSRNFLSFDELFPQIRKELKKVKHNVVLDGEVVILDENGIPDFQLIQNYKRTRQGNIVYYVFDILWYGDEKIEEYTLLERKELLKKVLPKSELIQFSEHYEQYGKKLFKEAAKQGFEGLIAKKNTSKYYENVRTKEWLKIKAEQRQEAIICGYTEPRNSRKYFGALILGVYEKGKLKYIGHTGTGFDEQGLKELYKKLQKYVRESSPFEKRVLPNNPVTWVEPKLVCEIKFSNWTGDSIMRHPVYMGLREDKAASEVVKEKVKK